VSTDNPAGGDALELADELLAAVGSLRRQARRSAGRPWPAELVSGAQSELVRLVRRQPDVSVAEAATELGLAANTVSTLVRQLVEAGLLVRASDSQDRRIARLRLTDRARHRVERWRDERASVVGRAVARLPAADRAALARAVPVLSVLAAGLAAEPAAPSPAAPTTALTTGDHADG